MDEAIKKIPVDEAIKKFPVNEALKKAPLACGYDKPCTRGDVKMKMRLTEEDLGEVSISIDIPPEAMIKIKEAGAHAGLEGWSLADLTSSVMCLGLTLALKHPAGFKKIAKGAAAFQAKVNGVVSQVVGGVQAFTDPLSSLARPPADLAASLLGGGARLWPAQKTPTAPLPC